MPNGNLALLRQHVEDTTRALAHFGASRGGERRGALRQALMNSCAGLEIATGFHLFDGAERDETPLPDVETILDLVEMVLSEEGFSRETVDGLVDPILLALAAETPALSPGAIDSLNELQRTVCEEAEEEEVSARRFMWAKRAWLATAGIAIIVSAPISAPSAVAAGIVAVVGDKLLGLALDVH
jgi:hypothetical protein